jgi:hypothetical protein
MLQLFTVCSTRRAGSIRITLLAKSYFIIRYQPDDCKEQQLLLGALSPASIDKERAKCEARYDTRSTNEQSMLA